MLAYSKEKLPGRATNPTQTSIDKSAFSLQSRLSFEYKILACLSSVTYSREKKKSVIEESSKWKILTTLVCSIPTFPTITSWPFPSRVINNLKIHATAWIAHKGSVVARVIFAGTRWAVANATCLQSCGVELLDLLITCCRVSALY